ncbi:MAG: hypothetical protein WC095_01020 [Candidatus Paceibacterota bacterium]
MNKKIKVKDRTIPVDPKKIAEEMRRKAKELVSKLPGKNKRPA